MCERETCPDPASPIRERVRDTLPSPQSIRPPLVRKFSSQFPQARIDEEPAWGIVATVTGPCFICFQPTRWVDKAFGETLHFCSETCLDKWLDCNASTLWCDLDEGDST